MSFEGLLVQGLVVDVAGREILRGIDLAVKPGEVVAVMGPNGSGKSTLVSALMGRPGYLVRAGSATFGGKDLLSLSTSDRAHAGLAVVSQYPGEVEGVDAYQLVEEMYRTRGLPLDSFAQDLLSEATGVGLSTALLSRWLNVDLSGGEKKRLETVLLALSGAKIALLDEIDSGLDIDALRAVSRRVGDQVREGGLGVLAITHYARLLRELVPTKVLVLAGGKIVREGDAGLALELEKTGYAEFLPESQEKPSDSIFGF
ncbi:MAG: Fe-S cluster assembly ATPase SufC [Acidimicrobiales bacterium]